MRDVYLFSNGLKKGIIYIWSILTRSKLIAIEIRLKFIQSLAYQAFLSSKQFAFFCSFSQVIGKFEQNNFCPSDDKVQVIIIMMVMILVTIF